MNLFLMCYAGAMTGVAFVSLFAISKITRKYDDLLDNYIQTLEDFDAQIKPMIDSRLHQAIQGGYGPKTVEELIDEWN